MPELSKHTRTRRQLCTSHGPAAPDGMHEEFMERGYSRLQKELIREGWQSCQPSGGQETTEKVTSFKEELYSELELLREQEIQGRRKWRWQ